MKNLSLILNVVLLIAVAILYYLHFSSKGTNTTVGGGKATAEAGETVVYFNSDTLLANYDLFDDLKKNLIDKRSQAERQLMTRGQKLEEEMTSYQKRAQAGLLSPNEMKTAEQGLMKKRDDYMVYEKTVSAGLMEEERLLNNQLHDSLFNYLKEYNKDKKYKVIFGYSKGGPIWLADEKLDITDQVVKGLNDKYKSEKDKQPEPKK